MKKKSQGLGRAGFCLVLAALFALGCSPARKAGHGLPAELKIGLLPDESGERLRRKYLPLAEYLADTLGVDCELVIPESYEALVRLFGDREIHLAYFGGVTFSLAKHYHGAVGLVVRDVDLRFTSYVLVRSDHEAAALSDLRGESFAFGSKWSTSGHFMPRAFMEAQGVDPEEFFDEVVYSGAHDRTALWVRDGKVAAGVANSRVVESFFTDGGLSKDEVRVLWETPPYVDYAWAVQPEFDKPTQSAIREAFLALDRKERRAAEILDSLSAGYFLPFDGSRFEQLEKAVMNSELVFREGR